jgi:hypothetical protein
LKSVLISQQHRSTSSSAGRINLPFLAGEFVWTGFDNLEPFDAKEPNGRNSLCQAIMRSTGQPRRISLKAASPGLRSVTADLKAK